MSGQIQIYLNQAEQDIHDHAAALEIINRVNLALASELDLEKLIQAVTDAGTQLSGAEFGAFFYNKGGPNGETICSTRSARPARRSRVSMPQNTPLFEQTFLGLGVVRSDDITRDLLRPAQGSSPVPVRSYLAVR
jgi:GAF domain-containing protein